MGQTTPDFRQAIAEYLDKHSAAELYQLVDDVIEQLADVGTPEYDAKLQEFVYRFCNKRLSLVNNKEIAQMETGCKAITNMLTKTNLNHKERSALMFIYLKFGDKGEQRLREILSRQSNYNEHITTVQLENYKKRNKFLGITCKKLIEWGVCANACHPI